MARIYYRLIRDGAISIEQVHPLWRAATQALLDADSAAPVPPDGPATESGTAETGEGAKEVTNILDGMTVAQLREYSANNGISLQGATRKDDILAAIRAAEKGGAPDGTTD